MAKRSTRSTRASKAPAREPKARSKKPARKAEVEVVEEAPGEGIDTAIIVMTTVILVVAFLFVDAYRGAYLEGLFFK